MRSDRPTPRAAPFALWLVSLAVANAAVWAAGSGEALARLIPLRCPLRMVTGIKCPTCGLGHALIEAWTGNWALSLQHHPLGVPALLLSGILALLHLVRPRLVETLFRNASRSLEAHPRLVTGAVAAYVLLGVAWHL
jgi:hypothetical protein